MTTDDEIKELEPLHAKALEFAKSEATMSISKMQRKFQIGYNRAARLCERLESEGALVFNHSTASWTRADTSGEGHGS